MWMSYNIQARTQDWALVKHRITYVVGLQFSVEPASLLNSKAGGTAIINGRYKFIDFEEACERRPYIILINVKASHPTQ